MDGRPVRKESSGSVCSVFSLNINSTSVGTTDDPSPPHDASSHDSNSCKICRDSSLDDEIISPCYCTGTMSRVHKSCLEQWLSAANKSSCEICNYKFEVKRSPKSFKEWLTHRQSRLERRYISGDVACFIILTPLVSASSYLCSKGAYYYFDLGLIWLSAGLVSLCAFLWCIYVFWVVVTLKFHHRMWNEWQHHNQVVHLERHRAHSISEWQEENRPSKRREDNQQLETNTPFLC